MKLIADSGSTKTAWRTINDQGQIAQANTIGFNPFFQDTDFIANELTTSLLPQLNGQVSSIYYYGTGCSTPENQAIIRLALERVFADVQHIQINTDMLGAARALCGHQPGLACILGTGSNTCFYDGQSIDHQVANLGFWLGDEGSGGYLGKTLVTAYLLNELPSDLATKFQKRHPLLTRDIVLENAYKKPSPNRYFAGFSKFLFDNRSHPFAYQLVYQAFSLFFERYISKYPNYSQLKVHFTGSVAFYYADILRQVANDKNITIGIVMENPIAGLSLYHSEE
jgi:glucosamine kinase